MQTIETSLGPWDVEDTGTGPPLLCVHGLLVDATLWDPVVPTLSASHRVVRPNDERLAATIPDCELRWITGAEAFSMIDQPAQVLAAVEPFLDRVTSAGQWVAP